MALVAGALQGLLLGQFAANGILGSSSPQLASALANGITTNILATANVTTVDAGTLGAGVGNSKVIGINSGDLKPMMIGMFAAQGMLGTHSAPLASAISDAFCIWFLAGNQTITSHAGVGLGVGTGKVIGLTPAAMEGILVGMLASSGILGIYSPKLAKAVANSIVPHILAMGMVITPIVGNPNILPGGGAGFGKVL